MSVTGEFIVGQNIDFQYDKGRDAAETAAKRKRRKSKKKKPARRVSKADEDIWNTSSEEERTRIMEFWANLSDDRRKELVKLDKDVLLEKVRRQKGHDCACSVCGRKREAAEQELDALYEAYFHELELYSARLLNDSSALMFQPLDSESEIRNISDESSSRGTQDSHSALTPDTTVTSRLSGKNNEDDWDLQWSRPGSRNSERSLDSKDKQDSSHEAYTRSIGPVNVTTSPAKSSENVDPSIESESGFAGGILSVADDIIRNDGRRFMDVMDHLDNSRLLQEGQFQSMYEQLYNSYNQVREGMARDVGQSIHATENGLSQLTLRDTMKYTSSQNRVSEVTEPESPKPSPETLPPPPPPHHSASSERPALPLDTIGHDTSHLTDEEFDDEEFDEEDYDDYDDELNSVPSEADEVDERHLSEKRSREGRKMLQTFAARMFEQRVFQAYREHVAQERQRKLLEEIELESRAAEEREAKKLKDKTRKKNKKLAQKQQREEELRKREREEREREEIQRSKEEAQRAAQREQERLRAEAHRAEIAARVAEMEREQRQRESREMLERQRKKQEEERHAAREQGRQKRERELREKRVERERQERMRQELQQEQLEKTRAIEKQSMAKKLENATSQTQSTPVSKASTPVRDNVSLSASPSPQVKGFASPNIALAHQHQSSPLIQPHVPSTSRNSSTLPFPLGQQDDKPGLWGRYNPLIGNSVLNNAWSGWSRWHGPSTAGATNHVSSHPLGGPAIAPSSESISSKTGSSPWARQSSIWTPPVPLETIRSAAILSYERISSQGLAVDGYVPSQVLYHAVLNSLNGPRFSQNDLYQACGVAGPAAHPLIFECLRDNVGLVTHLRYIPHS